jgi:dTDP-4-amino-4,6-dideoxygalactose transaminase
MQNDKNRKQPDNSRRAFLKSTGAIAAAVYLGHPSASHAKAETLALKGGPKAVTAHDPDAFTWPRYGPEEEKAMTEFLRHPDYWGQNTAFERAWKEFSGVPFATGHANGTSALMTMYYALNMPPGTEILVPSYTFFATITPMRIWGYVPVFVDVNPRTLNFDLEDAKRRLTKNTRALVPVHWYGLPCEMDHICDWAKEKGLLVLEDCSHSHGATVKGKQTGLWGEMAAASMQLGKPLPACEGGVGMYLGREHYERATCLGHYELCFRGRLPKESRYAKYVETGLGLKLRISPFAAVIAQCQLKKLPANNKLIVGQLRRLNDRLAQLPGLVEQAPRPDMERTYYACNTFFIDEAKAGMSRAACVKALQAEGVSVRAHSYTLQHKLALYHEDEWWHHKPQIPESLPGSELANRTAISMPPFTKEVPELVEQYAKAFEKVWAHRGEVG